jgi:serine/threonine protein kinase
MTDQWNSQNRQFAFDRDLRTAEMDPDGAPLMQSKRLGRYHIVAELGWGAMGLVYKAHDPRIDRIVAIKIITVSAADPKEDQAYRARFIREAQAAGRLSHPGIVTIYDVDEDPVSHTPYIVMEYVPGKRLDTFVAGLPSQRLSLDLSLALAQQIAEALDYAHSQGIVHRDIKPGNVIVTEECRAKIADFGIAKINRTDFTLPGQVLGTPAFMAPEQLLEGSADGRSDLFSLGVTLYWMLTGTKPFTGESATSVAFKLAYKDPIPATEISPNLHPHFDAVLRRALAKAPAARYQTGQEFALDLKLLSERKAPRVLDVSSASMKAGIWAQVAPRSLFFALRSMTLLTFSEIRIWLQPLLTMKSQKRVRKWDLRWFAVGAALLLITAVGLRFAMGRRAAASALNSSTSAMRAIANPTLAPPLPPPVIEIHEIDLQNLEPANADSKPARKRTTEQPSASKHGSSRLVPVKNAVTAAHKAPPISAEMVGKPEPVASSIPDAIPEPKAPATLLTLGEHPFRSATLSISVDGKLASEEQLTGARKLPFGSARGIISEAIRLAPGSHVVEVHVVSERDHCDQTQTIEGQFQADEVRKLELKFVARVLQLSWK